MKDKFGKSISFHIYVFICVSGIMKDAFGSFGPSIHICGVLMFLGGCSFGMAPVARKLNARKERIDPKRLAQCTRESKV